MKNSLAFQYPFNIGFSFSMDSKAWSKISTISFCSSRVQPENFKFLTLKLVEVSFVKYFEKSTDNK